MWFHNIKWWWFTKKILGLLGYDLGDNDEMFDMINEVDALVTRVVNLIYDVVEEVDVLLHGRKVYTSFIYLKVHNYSCNIISTNKYNK